MPYCLSNLVSSKKAAFTLAEVLITLGIIGVVAAMTIPSLVKNYRERVIVTKVKQGHAQLLNAVQMYVAQNNCQNMLCLFDTSKTSDEVAAELTKVLKKSKVCKSADTENVCKYYGVKANTPFKKDGVYATSIGLNNFGRIWLQNGIIFQVTMQSSCIKTQDRVYRDENGFEIGREEVTVDACAYVYMDINNTQDPNQLGADFYQYVVKSNGNIEPVHKNLLNNALLYNKIEYTPYNVGEVVK